MLDWGFAGEEPEASEEDPCECGKDGLTDEQTAALRVASEKAKAGEELSEADVAAMLCAFECAKLNPLGLLSTIFGFLTAIGLKTVLGWVFSAEWLRFPGVTCVVYFHVDDTHWDFGGWNSLDGTVSAVLLYQGGSVKGSKSGSGKVRIEVHGSVGHLDPPLEACDWRFAIGEFRMDMDGSGFPEVHIDPDEEPGAISDPQEPPPPQAPPKPDSPLPPLEMR